jgi:WD40 repeat protein/tetratricopeptide (TPR) repeat protein
MKTSSPQFTNPFPGLRPFRSDEHHLFFGREEQTAALLQLLRTNRFLAVVGTSGSGKSSLVRAGMIAALHGGTMTRAGSTWEVMLLRPGGSPIENLARAFVEADLYDPEDPSTLPRLLATLNRSRFGLVEAMKQCELFEPGTNLLVVVDQFEELFRFRQQGVDSEETAAAFVNLLLTASEQAECPIYVTITMRSDYLGDCSEIPGLAEAVNNGEYLIPRLLRDQKRDAIEKPIGVGGARISPMLVQRLLNDVGDDPDQLPVLQHALMRMWDAWSAGGDRDRPIDFADFEATGGLGAALSNHADEIHDSLPTDGHRAACEKIFKTLTEKGDDNRGIRRPTRLAQLRAIADSDRETVTTVLDAFRGHGVTFLMPGTEVVLGDRTVIDLSHESLMRGWQRLRMWVEDEAQSARIFRRLLDTARLWGDGKAGLFRDPDLQIALSWRDQEAPNAEWADQYGGDFDAAIAFLETSHAAVEAEERAQEAARQRELEQARQLAEAQQLRLEQQQRAARKLRIMIAGLAAVAVIAGVACALALFANQQAIRLAAVARQNEENANRNATRAEQSQQETASALAEVASQKRQVEGSLSKAEAAERLARAAEESGRKLLYTTDMQLAPFVWRDDRTTAEQLRVLLAKHIPSERMKDEGGRMKGENTAAEGSGSSFILHPSSFPTKSDLRGFEWRYYQHLLEDSATVLSGHGGSVVAGAFAADGPVVTLDQNGQLRRWDLSSQAEDPASRRDLPRGPAAQRRVLSPDGRLAALAVGNKVQVFDTSTGDEMFRIDSASTSDRRLVFSRDGDRLVVVDDKIRWCGARDGQVIASVNQKFDRIQSLALSADGLTLAVVGHGKTAQFISAFRLDATAKVATPLAKDFGFTGSLNASAMTPDGGRVAVGTKLGGILAVFDTDTGRRITYHGSAHASPISAMAFFGDGARLATADGEGTIKIWADPQKLSSRSTALLTLKGHQGAVTTVGFSLDGKRLITTSADETARVWDLENAGAAIRPLEVRTGDWPPVVSFSPDGQLIAVAHGKSLHLCDAATGRVVRSLPVGEKVGVASVAFSPTDHRLLAVGYDRAADISDIALWDIDSGTEVARLPGATDLPDFRVDENKGVFGVLRFSPDGKYLVAGFGSRVLTTNVSSIPLKVWEVATRRPIRRLLGHMNFCNSLNFTPDGTLLASGSRDGTAILWSTATWTEARTLLNPDRNSLFGDGSRGMVEDVAFSPDGKTLALASREASVQLWEVATGKLLETLRGHPSSVNAVAFSPDGRTLASGGADQTVRLWNVETRRELMQLDAGGVELGEIHSLAFSPNGRQLLAAGSHAAFWSTTAMIWNDPDRAAERLRLLLKSNADFASRIRMLSENLRLHEALAKLDAKDQRVRAALAAAQANWHASRKAWPEAARAFDRLAALGKDEGGKMKDEKKPGLVSDSSFILPPSSFLRTPGLLRLATALLHQDRPAVAASLLRGGGKSRSQEGLPPVVGKVGVGLEYSVEGATVRVTEPLPGSPGSRAGLVAGDIIVQVDDTELTGDSIPRLGDLLDGEAGTKVRLTVRHAGGDRPEMIEVIRARYVKDTETGDQLYPLLAVVDERLATAPRDAGLLELRAELADQWSDANAQVTDYTAAIEALAGRTTEAAAADLKRLYARRGKAHLALGRWQQALDDFARAVTDATTDESLLADQAQAQAEVLLSSGRWTVLRPVEAKSDRGSTLSVLPDDSILAGGANPLDDHYRVVTTVGADIELSAVRLEALTHDSLPRHGPGRHPGGHYHQASMKVVASPPGGKAPIPLEFVKVWADRKSAFAIQPNGDWNTVGGGEGRDCTAIWATPKPVSLVAGTRLTFELQYYFAAGRSENLGHFRLSMSNDPAAIERESERIKLTDPWVKLATAYRLRGDQPAIDRLIDRRPKLAGPIGDLFTQGKDEEKDWKRAIALYSFGLKDEGGRMKDEQKTANPSGSPFILHPSSFSDDLLAKRARAYEAIRSWAAAAADWSRAATGNPDGAAWLGDFARRLDVGDQFALANEYFEKARALYERSLAADPENDPVAAQLAQVLLERLRSRWTVLRPTEMKSEKGATLTLQRDGSILASGTNVEGDVYTISAVGPLDRVAAVRLEVLPDASLPHRGPGRHETGNFHLRAFRLYQAPGAGEKARKPVPLRRAWASYEWKASDEDIVGTIDESLNKFWHVWGRLGEAHEAVFLLRDPAPGKDRPFLIELRHRLNLGRFRLSVRGDTAALEREDPRGSTAVKATDPFLKLADAYALNGLNDEALQHFGRALDQAGGDEARRTIIEIAARHHDVLSALIQRRPDDPQPRLALARSLAKRGKQHLAEKLPAQAQAELERSREIFARLRPVGDHWTTPSLLEMKSQAGARMERQGDGSVFVHQAGSVQKEIYSLAFESRGKGIKGLRLEALADPRLPENGPGWYQNGTFGINELTLEAAPTRGPGQPRRIPLRNAWADFSAQVYNVGGAIDGDNATGWGIHPESGKDHTAFFELAEEVGAGQDMRLTVRINQLYRWSGFVLGRFRLSTTHDTNTLQVARLFPDLKDSEIADLCIDLARARAEQGHTDLAVATFAEALPLAEGRAGKARIVAAAAPLAGVLERLAERAAGDGPFQAELARHFAESGQTPLADVARSRARLAFEQELAREPEDFTLAGELTDLLLPPIDARPAMIVPTSENEAVRWRFATTKPPADWTSAAFDDSTWKTGAGIFGKDLPQGVVARTEWSTSDIWLRRKFEWKPDPAVQSLLARVIHDDAFELFINGQQVLSRQVHTPAYDSYPVDARAVGLLKPGTNTMAVHCNSPHGTQSIDVGLLGLPSSPRVTRLRLAAVKIADPWARLAAAYIVIGDQPASDRLLAAHPSAAAGIGDLYAEEQDWGPAIAAYDKAIAGGGKDAGLFAARAEAHEKLEHWELAAADWGNADLHAADKTVRYGIISQPALERRAGIHVRLQQDDRAAEDFSGLLKPDRLGNNSMIFIKRGETYDRLRQWQKARADYEQAIKHCQPDERGAYHFWRARHFAAQSQWKQAAKDLQQVYDQRTDFRRGSWTEWWALRDAALIYAVAGDVENFDRLLAGMYQKPSEATPGEDESKWIVLTMLLFPEAITDANRPRLLELAGKADAYSRPRLIAAIRYRSGDFGKAAELFDADDPGPWYMFLAAMNDQKLGRRDRARKRLDEANAWLRGEREKDRGAGVPRPHEWRDWAYWIALQYEACESIEGPGAGSEKLAERAVGEAQFQTALARHYGGRGNAPLADALRTKARQLFEKKLAQEPENSTLADGLAHLLLDRREVEDAARWTVLKPTEMKSTGGETFAVEGDGSILVGGPTPDRAVYTLKFRTDSPTLTAIRLETIPDARLPHGGAGRYPDNGNFHVAEFTAAIVSGPADAKPTPIELNAAMEDVAYEHYDAKNSIDGNPRTYWDTYPKLREAHWAVFGLKSPAQSGGGSLSITLDSGITGWKRHGLGRFRLSVSHDPAALERERERIALEQLTDPWTRLAVAYVLAGEADRAADLIARSGQTSRIAALLDSGSPIDAVLASIRARHPEKLATVFQASAAAAERGQIDRARRLYAWLVESQPKNGMWKERSDQLRPGVLAVWNFDDGVGTWGNASQCVLSAKGGVLTARTTGDDPLFSTPIGAPAGGKAIVLRYRADRAFTMQVFWADTAGSLDDSHHGDYPLPAASGVWREAILPFASRGPISVLRLDPNISPDHPLEVDSIVLRELEPGDIASLPADNALLTRCVEASQAAGRTRDALAFLARAAAEKPEDTILSLRLAALQAWFGQEKELAATRRRVLAFAKVHDGEQTAERAVKACSIHPSTDKEEIEAALGLARKLGEPKVTGCWNLLALGMAEYRGGDRAAAEKALIAAVEAIDSDPGTIRYITGAASFFRAMNLFQQGRRDEARQLAMATAAKMKPLPADDQNPLAGDTGHDDLVVWLAYKEAKALIRFDAAPAAPAQPQTK